MKKKKSPSNTPVISRNITEVVDINQTVTPSAAVWRHHRGRRNEVTALPTYHTPLMTCLPYDVGTKSKRCFLWTKWTTAASCSLSFERNSKRNVLSTPTLMMVGWRWSRETDESIRRQVGRRRMTWMSSEKKAKTIPALQLVCFLTARQPKMALVILCPPFGVPLHLPPQFWSFFCFFFTSEVSPRRGRGGVRRY